MDNLAKIFPPGVTYDIPYDTTRFVEVSIQEVVATLRDAMILVLLVVYLFLQSWRATLIPATAVPVSLIGTFAGMSALGFSINTLTLFGLVLAIGIVVDDAIVVVENVERHMANGLSPKEAAKKAMTEVTGPVIAIVLVLCAVFVPVGFLGGITGQLYKQFAITIAVSVTISGFVALTLSPALCALVLKPGHETRRGFFGLFNRAFDWVQHHYATSVGLTLKHRVLSLAIFAMVITVAVSLFKTVPMAFLPEEDQGYFITVVQLPDGASKKRTDAVLDKVEQYYLSIPAVYGTQTLSGQNFVFNTRGTNTATMFAPLQHWDERTGKEQHVKSIIAGAFREFAKIPEALVLAFNAPSIRGLGATGGFSVQVQDPSGGDFKKFAATAPGVHRQGQARSGDRSGEHELSRQRSPCPCQDQSGASQSAGRADFGSLRHAPGVLRQSLRQRLRQVRPGLSRADGGGAAVPIQSLRHQQDLCASADRTEWTRSDDDPARHGGEHHLQQRARSRDPLQRIQYRPCAGCCGARATVPARLSMPWSGPRKRC